MSRTEPYAHIPIQHWQELRPGSYSEQKIIGKPKKRQRYKTVDIFILRAKELVVP